MTARTHDAVAFSALVTLAAFYPPSSLNVPTLFTSLVANIVGSLIPDMDQAGNRLWDLLPSGNLLGRVFRKLFLSHRTLSHSFLGIFLTYKIFEWLLPKILNPNYLDIKIVFWSLMVGYVSHLAADAITKEGIPLLFPIPVKIGFPPLSFLRVKTGSWVENFVILPGVAIYLFWFVGGHQKQLLSIIKLLGKE